MKKTETSNVGSSAKRKELHNTFKNFAEYWHFVKSMPTYQRKVLFNSMSSTEQKTLRASYDSGGWEDLFMRNACDETLDEIVRKTNIDLLEVKCKVMSGNPQLMHKEFWQYINNCFDMVPMRHIAYIFDGIIVEDFDEDYVKLVSYTIKEK